MTHAEIEDEWLKEKQRILDEKEAALSTYYSERPQQIFAKKTGEIIKLIRKALKNLKQRL